MAAMHVIRVWDDLQLNRPVSWMNHIVYQYLSLFRSFWRSWSPYQRAWINRLLEVFASSKNGLSKSVRRAKQWRNVPYPQYMQVQFPEPDLNLGKMGQSYQVIKTKWQILQGGGGEILIKCSFENTDSRCTPYFRVKLIYPVLGFWEGRRIFSLDFRNGQKQLSLVARIMHLSVAMMYA